MKIEKVRFDDLMNSLRPLPEAQQAANVPRFNVALHDSPTACVEGERNNRIASLSGTWLRRGNTLDEVITLARAANKQFSPPLDDTEVIATCSSIARTHQRNNISAVPVDDDDLTRMALT